MYNVCDVLLLSLAFSTFYCCTNSNNSKKLSTTYLPKNPSG